MARFCGYCGKPLGVGRAFCEDCGKPTGAPPVAAPTPEPREPEFPTMVMPRLQFETPPPLPAEVAPVPPPLPQAEIPPTLTLEVPSLPPPLPAKSAPLPKAPPKAAASLMAPPPPPSSLPSPVAPPSFPPAARPAGPHRDEVAPQAVSAPPPVKPSGLPPSAPLWDFQQKVIDTGAPLAQGLGPNPVGPMGIVSRIIRSTFLDPRVAREAALDEAGTRDAVLAILLTSVPSVLLSLLFSGSIGPWVLTLMISTLLMSLLSLGVMVWLLSALSMPMLSVKLSAGQLLRALAYAQGASVLAFVPVFGRVLGLWSIVSGLAAVRAISGAETRRAAAFMIVGAVAAVLAAMALAPLILGALTVF